MVALWHKYSCIYRSRTCTISLGQEDSIAEHNQGPEWVKKIMASTTQVWTVLHGLAMVGPPWFLRESKVRNWSPGHWWQASDLINASSLLQITPPLLLFYSPTVKAKVLLYFPCAFIDCHFYSGLQASALKRKKGLNPFPAEWVLRALIDFTLSNARRFYSSMGNPLDGRGLRVPPLRYVLSWLDGPNIMTMRITSRS